ncbi:flippase-like domain-containing protein [Candidatus Poribacteria bacterium]|nr:flippase-like domain-containing protein [Candidatus Poribacteria bacterium]
MRLPWIARYVLPTVLAIFVSYLLLREIDISEIPKTLSGISIKALIIGFGCYCLLVIAKTLRFRTILGLKTKLYHLLPILALHTFWGNILPMRTGDVSYVYLMQRHQKVEATQGIASLMVASIIDLMLLIGLMVTTSLLLHSKISGTLSWTLLYLMPLLIGCTVVGIMILACLAPKFCFSVAEKCTKPLLNTDYKWLTWSVNKILSIVSEITSFRFNLHFLKIWIYSFLCLLIRFGFQCYLVSEMGVDIPLSEVLFALAFTNGFNLLPIQSVGNFGTTEFPFAWLLHFFGTPLENATVTGFSLHILILLYCLPLGVYGVIMKKAYRNDT